MKRSKTGFRLATAAAVALFGASAIAAEMGEPKHGGKLTVVTTHSKGDPGSWDIGTTGDTATMFFINPYAEYLLGADVLTYGPRGTDEYSFGLPEAEVPEKWVTGTLAESWELTTDPLGVTFKIREGVMWTGNRNIGMEPREFTAEDAAFSLNRYLNNAVGANKIGPFVESFEATDRYTLRMNFSKLNVSWAWLVGYALFPEITAPEQVEAGPLDWKNQVGTGPFILTNYVPGSYASYQRNPNWWNKDVTINGKTYEVPFIDELVYPIIPNEASRIAALRTGRIDIATAVNAQYEETLKSSSPDLMLKSTPAGKSLDLKFNALNGPSTDLDFRRAVMLGVDQQAIVDAVIPGGTVGGYPFSRHLGPGVFTDFGDMPQEIGALFGHDPDKAKQMIADQGKAGVDLPIYYISNDSQSSQAAALLADQLSQIGINPVLNPEEPAALSQREIGDGSNWEGIILYWGGNSKIARGADVMRTKPWLSLHLDQDFNKRMDATMAMTDDAERNASLKEQAIYMIGQVNEVAIGEGMVFSAWWPWVKNYYGEVDTGFSNMNPMLSTLWIDSETKNELGY